MANSLSSLFAAKHRVNEVIVDKGADSREAADILAAELRITYPSPCAVKVSSYKMGPRKAPITRWTVRVYRPKA